MIIMPVLVAVIKLGVTNEILAKSKVTKKTVSIQVGAKKNLKLAMKICYNIAANDANGNKIEQSKLAYNAIANGSKVSMLYRIKSDVLKNIDLSKTVL